MRKLLYLTVVVVTLIGSGVVHFIVRGDPYRFHYAALTGDLTTIDRMLATGTSVDVPDNFG